MLWVAAIAAAYPTLAAAASAPAPPPLEGPAVVLDGNTLEVAGERVRLFGIDAPKLDSAEGRRARAALHDLVAGVPVRCPPVDPDRYSRELVRCAAGPVPDLGRALLAQGWAIVARSFTPGTEVAQAYDAAELAARREPHS